MSRGGRPWRVKALGLLTWAYIGWSLLPLASVVLGSLRAPLASPSVTAYGQVFESGPVRTALTQSLKLALLSTLIAGPMGLGLAVGMARWRGRPASIARLVAVSPLVVPELLLATALFEVFVHLFVVVRFGTTAQLLGHVTLALPFVVLIVASSLASIDPEIEDTARDLGASPLQALRLIVLPLAAPALIFAVVVAFTVSLNDFVMSQFLCIENSCATVPMILFGGGASPITDAVAVVSTAVSVLMAMVVCMTWAWVRTSRRRSVSNQV